MFFTSRTAFWSECALRFLFWSGLWDILSENENIDIGIRLFVPTYMRTHTYPSSDKSPVKKRNGVNKRTTQTNVQAYTQAYLSVCLVRSEQRPNPIRPNPKPWKEIQWTDWPIKETDTDWQTTDQTKGQTNKGGETLDGGNSKTIWPSRSRSYIHPLSHGQADCAHNYPQDPHSLCSLKVAATM